MGPSTGNRPSSSRVKDGGNSSSTIGGSSIGEGSFTVIGCWTEETIGFQSFSKKGAGAGEAGKLLAGRIGPGGGIPKTGIGLKGLFRGKDGGFSKEEAGAGAAGTLLEGRIGPGGGIPKTGIGLAV